MPTVKDVLYYLHNEDLSLEARLRIALSTFGVGGMSNLKNKEAALKWLKFLISQQLSGEDRSAVYSVLKNIISCMADVWLHPELGEIVISILKDSVHNEMILECCVEVLKNMHFQRYFLYNVQGLADIVMIICDKMTINNDVQESIQICDYVVSSLLNVNGNAAYNSCLKFIFVKDLIPALAKMVVNMKFDLKSIEHCCSEILFSEIDFRNSFAECMLVISSNSHTNDENVINIIDVIKKYPGNVRNEDLPLAFSIIFSAYLDTNSNSNSKFQVFVGLNSYVDIYPIPVIDNSSKKVILNERNVSIANTLVEKISDLSLESRVGSYSLMDWLSALIDIILDGNTSTLEKNVLKILKNLLNCSPILMDNCLKKFVKKVMLLKKSNEDIKHHYSSLCLDVLNIHIRVNRMQKLISALLVTVNSSLEDISDDIVPDKFDILPEEIFDKIKNAITNLPNTVQNVALLRTLFYHLEKDCIEKLKEDHSKKADNKLVLIFDLVAYLISRFISGTRVIDHSVPDVVKNKFEECLNCLAVLLRDFGIAVISKEHDSKLMEAFLHLCLVWGDIQMVIMTYESNPRKIPKQVGSQGKSATNLVYLHPYLSDYHWQLIAQRMVNFGNENCITLMNNLVLQKIHALRLLEDEIEGPYLDEGPAAVCAQFLVHQANERWIFTHISEFVHLLKPVDISNLSLTLVKYYKNSGVDENLIDEDFQEARPLVLAMLCATFYSIGKQFYKVGIKGLRKIMKKLNYEEMLKAEICEEDREEVVDNINKQIDEIGVLISRDPDYTEETEDVDIEIERDMSLLITLPAPYLSKENKSIIFLLTLYSMRNIIKLKSKDQKLESSLNEITKFLSNVKDGVIVPSSLVIKEELPWIYRGLQNIPNGQVIMEWLCEINEIPLDQIIQSCDLTIEKMDISDIKEESSTLNATSSSPTQNLKKLNRYWKLALKEKNQMTRNRLLSKACRMATKYMVSSTVDTFIAEPTMTKALLDIFKNITQNKTFRIRYPLIDLCFELSSFAANGVLHNEELLPEAIELLFGLCKVRMPMLVDRIPSFYLCYRTLFTEIAQRSSVSECRNLETLTCAAHKLEKLTDTLQKNKKDFNKTAASAISDLLSLFTEINMEDDVKMHLKNVVYCWFSICDSHVYQFLTDTISHKLQRIFQQFWSDFNKYYKFSGKV